MKITTRIFSALVAFIMVFQSATVVFAATKKSAYTGITYTQNSQFDDYEIVNGIDVSEHNGSINFEKVAADGIDYVIIRAGYGSYTSQEDDYFETNYKNAKAAGLKVGAYWYSYATAISGSEKSIANEAKTCLKVIDGKTFDLPIFYDLEEKSQFNKGSTFCTNAVTTFTKAIEDAGYISGLYMSRSPLNSYISESVRNSTILWVAEYNTSNKYSGNYLMWQYSSSGSVSGVSGNCDVNFMYLGEGGLLQFSKISYDDKKYYTGSAITPSIDVTIGKTKLVEGTDYSVTYSSNTDVGVGKIKITAKGDYYGTKTVKFNIVPKVVTNLKLTQKGINSLSYSWTKSTGADGYIVTATNTSNNSVIKKYTTTNSVAITGLNGGTEYAVKVKPYFLDGTTKVYSSYCDEKFKITKPAKISGLKSTSTTNSITLKWNKQPNVTGYKVYKYDSSKKSYRLIKTIKGANTTSYTNKDLSAGSKRTYRVKAYSIVEPNYYNGESTQITACSMPATVNLKSAFSYKTRQINVKWGTVSNTTGYEIKYSKSKTFASGNKSIYVSGSKSSSKVLNTATSKTYYVKVRAYRTINGKKYYGTWSNVITTKVK